MEIDFHHGVTYVLARLAGFKQEEAEIVAYSAQHVDDAICDDVVMFSNGAIYKPICSAHKAVDYRNLNALKNHLVWIPFHFLPANCLGGPAECRDTEFSVRVICRPNSYIARDMVKECIKHKDKPNALHRLGVTMHVFADTWAHQGFIGIENKANKVQYLEDDEVSRKLVDKVSRYFLASFDRELSKFIDDVMPLGHGAVLSYPDKPFLKWKYKDHTGRLVERNNPPNFLEAAKNMYIAMKQFIEGDSGAEIEALDSYMAEKLYRLLSEICDWDSSVRHSKWLDRVANGEFGFVDENVIYDSEGSNSWEHKAFGGKIQSGMVYEYSNDFLESDWKKFQDAIHDHYYYVTRILLPYYGLCVV